MNISRIQQILWIALIAVIEVRIRTLLIGLLILVISAPIVIAVLPPPGARRFDRNLRRNTELFVTARDYLIGQEFESLHMRSSDAEAGKMFAGIEHGLIPIDDEDALRAIRTLFF
jgi:hypothetical protein